MEKVNLSEKDVEAIARRRNLAKRTRWEKVRMVVWMVVIYAVVVGCAFGGMELLEGDIESVYVTASGHELRWEGNDRVLDGEIMTKEPADLNWSAGVIALFVLAGLGFGGLAMLAYIEYDRKPTAFCRAFLQHWKATGDIPTA